MKVTGVLISTLLAVTVAAVPQASNTDKSEASQATLTPQQSCSAKCADTDVNCRATCAGVPHPQESDANQTTECAAKCDQGDGSPEETEKYSKCVQACISSFFPGAATANGASATAGGTSAASNTAVATSADATGAASSGSAKATKSGASATEAEASGTSTGASRGTSASGSASASESTGAAVNNVPVMGSAAGLASIFVAILAL